MKERTCIAILLFFSLRLYAQDSTGARQENWPEIDVFYKFNNKIRLYAMYSATRLRNSNFTDGGAGLYVDYFALSSLRKKFTAEMKDSTRGYYLWLRAGYYYSSTPAGAKNPVSENTITTEVSSRFHLPLDVLFTGRNRFDWRILNGDFNPRYRLRARFDKDMHTEYLHFTPYFYGEYFANLNHGNSNRFRLCFGIEMKVAAHIDFESYFLHQFSNKDNVDAVNAIGLALKFHLSSPAVKKMFSKKKE